MEEEKGSSEEGERVAKIGSKEHASLHIEERRSFIYWLMDG